MLHSERSDGQSKGKEPETGSHEAHELSERAPKLCSHCGQTLPQRNDSKRKSGASFVTSNDTISDDLPSTVRSSMLSQHTRHAASDIISVSTLPTYAGPSSSSRRSGEKSGASSQHSRLSY